MSKISNNILKLSQNLNFVDINEKFSICYNKNAFKPILLPNTFKDDYLKGIREINNPGENIIKMFVNNYIGFFDEELSKKDIYDKLKSDFDKKDATLNVRFIPSYNCDKNCSYCLIQNIRSKMKESFSLDYLGNLKTLLSRYQEISNQNLKNVSVTIIGGEPTLEKNWNITKFFLSEINKYFDKKEHVLVTNGYGVNDSLLEEFKKLGGKSIYLSYDLRGNIVDDSEPISKSNFEKFKELCDFIVSKGISLSLDFKCNEYSKLTLEVKTFLDYLIKKDDSINIVISKIISQLEYDVLENPQCQRYELVDLKEEGILPVYYEFMEAYPFNFSYPRQFEVMIYRCSTASMKSLVVFPSGKVSLCGKLYSSNPDNIPYIYDFKGNEFDESLAKSYCNSIFDDEECGKCDYHLICGGKCPFKKGKCDKEKLNVELLLDIYKRNIIRQLEKRK